jgi:hypothetical protein
LPMDLTGGLGRPGRPRLPRTPVGLAQGRAEPAEYLGAVIRRVTRHPRSRARSSSGMRGSNRRNDPSSMPSEQGSSGARPRAQRTAIKAHTAATNGAQLDEALAACRARRTVPLIAGPIAWCRVESRGGRPVQAAAPRSTAAQSVPRARGGGVPVTQTSLIPAYIFGRPTREPVRSALVKSHLWGWSWGSARSLLASV